MQPTYQIGTTSIQITLVENILTDMILKFILIEI